MILSINLVENCCITLTPYSARHFIRYSTLEAFGNLSTIIVAQKLLKCMLTRKLDIEL